MKVLLINYEFPPLGGGAGNATRHLATRRAGMGDVVKVLTMAHGDLPTAEWRDGYEIIRAPSRRALPDRCTPFEMTTFMLGSMYSTWKLSRRWRPDAAMAFFSIPGAPVAWLLKVMTGVPYIVSLRGGDVPGFLPEDLQGYHRLTTPLIRFLWKRAACVTANGTWLADLARRCAPDLPVEVVPNGVDPRSHQPGTSSRAKGLPRLLFVGRLARQKGVDVLLEAMARPETGTDVILDIVGDGGERPALEAQTKRLGLEKRVIFHSWLRGEELRKQYQSADIFVLPSRDEGMPNVLLEAAASGLPLIATRVGSNPDALREGETGLLVDADDPVSLSKALNELISDPDRAGRMGTAGRIYMKQHFSWDTMTQRYRALLLSTCREG